MGVKQYIEYEYSEDNVNWHSLLTSLDYYQRERTVTDTDGVLTYSGFTAGVLVRVDGETPVFGVDYRDGLDGQFVSYAYLLKETNPASPIGGSFDGTVETYPTDPDTGDSWSDNLIAPGNNQYVWVSRTVYKKDLNDEWVNIDWTYPVRFTGLNGRVPVVGEDYFNGTLGVYTSFIFYNSTGSPSTPIGGTYDGTIETFPVGGWTDNPVSPPVGEFVWVSKTKYSQDALTGLWVNIGWSLPAQFSGHQGYKPVEGVDFFDAINGTFTSYAFKLSITQPATPTTGSFSVIGGVATEVTPVDWTDDVTTPPNGSYIWITKRIYTETAGSWVGSTWTTPAKFSGEHGYTPVYGTDYTDGTSGIYTSYVFRNLSGVPLVPLGGTYDGAVETMPSDQVGGFWTDDPIAPLVGERVWVSIARYENDVNTGTWSKSGWSTPVKFDGEKGQYRKNLYQRSVIQPVNDPTVAPLDWADVPPPYVEGSGGVWNAFAEFTGNDIQLTPWTILLIETVDTVGDIIDAILPDVIAGVETELQSVVDATLLDYSTTIAVEGLIDEALELAGLGENEDVRISIIEQINSVFDTQDRKVETQVVSVALSTAELDRAAQYLLLTAADEAAVARLDLAEVDIEGNATAVSSVTGTVNNPTTGLSAAYNLAQVAKTTADGNASSVTVLQNSVNHATTGLAATFTLAGQAKITADGNVSSIGTLNTAVSNAQGTANSGLTLASSIDDSLDVYRAAAQLKVNANGRVGFVQLDATPTVSQIKFKADEIFFLNNSDIPVVYWDTGLGKYVFNGDLQATSGTFSGNISGATGAFSGTISAGNVVGDTAAAGVVTIPSATLIVGSSALIVVNVTVSAVPYLRKVILPCPWISSFAEGSLSKVNVTLHKNDGGAISTITTEGDYHFTGPTFTATLNNNESANFKIKIQPQATYGCVINSQSHVVQIIRNSNQTTYYNKDGLPYA
jgi:hypothetical protein